MKSDRVAFALWNRNTQASRTEFTKHSLTSSAMLESKYHNLLLPSLFMLTPASFIFKTGTSELITPKMEVVLEVLSLLVSALFVDCEISTTLTDISSLAMTKKRKDAGYFPEL
jgi:hypothetical protein